MQLTIGGTNRLELSSHQTISSSAPVSLSIVFDTTGSMDSYIADLIDCINEMAVSLTKSGIAWSTTVIPFGDLRIAGDTIETDLPWVSSVERVTELLDAMPHNGGGGNDGESSFEAIDAGVTRLADRNSGAKVLLILTDDGAHRDNFSEDEILKRLVQSDILVYSVAPSQYEYYRQFAHCTGGEFLELSNQVDLSSISEKMTLLGRTIAERTNRVLMTGGSPQVLLQLENGQ